MANARQTTKLKSALGPSPDCPPFDRLVRALEAPEGDARRAAEAHTASCAHCRDEVATFREFLDPQPRPGEERAIRSIAQGLEKQRFGRPARVGWSWMFGMRAWAAAACLLLVAGGAFYLRRGPGEPSSIGVGDGVMRSQAVEPIEPAGDLRQMPGAFRWQPVPGAARYQVRVLRVDRSELWRGDTSGASLAVPPEVAAVAVPGTALVWEVAALDAAGRPLGTPGSQTFRIVAR